MTCNAFLINCRARTLKLEILVSYGVSHDTRRGYFESHLSLNAVAPENLPCLRIKAAIGDGSFNPAILPGICNLNREQSSWTKSDTGQSICVRSFVGGVDGGVCGMKKVDTQD